MKVSFLNNKLSSQFAYIVARGTSGCKFSDTSRHDTSPMACRYAQPALVFQSLFSSLLRFSVVLKKATYRGNPKV